MARVVAWSLVLALGGVFVAVVDDLLRARRAAGRDLPAYSVYSQAGDGLGEAAHVLAEFGWTPVAVTRPLQAARAGGLLVMAEPGREGLLTGEEEAVQPAEAEAVLRWVGRGNTLLLCSRRNTPLHQALRLVVTEGEPHPDDLFTPVTLGQGGVYTEGIERLSVGTQATLHGRPDSLPLWSVHGQPGALMLRLGKGRVIVAADPVFLTRHGLVRDDGEPRDDNVLFLTNLASLCAKDDRVYFDEYHHGIRSGGGFWTYLGYHGERLTLVPLLLVLAIAGWSAAVRLGPAVPLPRAARADAVDYASALGRLYQRAGARRLLARTLVRGFLVDRTRHLRLRRQALPAVILAAWRQQHARAAATGPTPAGGLDPETARLQTLLRGVGELRKGPAGERQLLAWTQAFDDFIKEVASSQ
jgi:hypothetical protein